jgi:putative hydrolase of the HAD superfamily
MTPLAVLFDLDNTLAHRSLSIASYARRFIDDFGERLHAATSEAVAALIDERDGGGYGVPGSPFATVRDDVAHALATRLAWHEVPSSEALTRHWFAHFPDCSIEMPGASALLDRLAARGLRLAIVSNGKEASRRALASGLGLDRRVQTVVSSERAGARKPDARPFLLAAEELGVPPQRCWFVGDHPVNDIAGAHAAGMRAIWLRGFHAWPAELQAHTTIAALADLEALIPAPSAT